MKDYDDNEALQKAIDDGIINIDMIKAVAKALAREEYLDKHPYSIWQNEQGMWLTHIKDRNNKIVVRRRKTREELETMIADHYRNMEQEIHIHDAFYEWMNGKLEYGEIQKQSYDRYITDFVRFFSKSEPICRKKLNNITENDLEDFIKRTIKDKQLTHKAYTGLRTLIKGIFKYAKKRKWTDISISYFFDDLQLSSSIFKKQLKDSETEIFGEDEIPIVIDYLKRNADIFNLAILLQFQIGGRIGEIVALKKEDICIADNYILISRTEIKYKDENGKWVHEVSDMPKTAAGFRKVVIPPSADWTIEQILKINPKGEFLFMNRGHRIRENSINKRLSTVCDNLGLKHRSTHKIRKTYATTLLDNAVGESFVAEQLGHADISTTKAIYYIQNKSQKTKQAQIQRAINY